MRKYIFLFFSLLISNYILIAQQDPYFSTYLVNPSIINSSLSSTYDNNNVVLVYRNQWANYSPTNLSLSSESPSTGILSLNLKNRDKSVSFGMNIITDNLGPKEVFNLSPYLSIAKKINESYLSLGVSPSFKSTTLNFSSLIFVNPSDPFNVGGRETQSKPDLGVGISYYNDKILLGSLVTYSDFQDFVTKYFPNLNEYINRIGGDQIRNMGTIGGNIANGSPIGDIAPLFLALGAKMKIISKETTRKINVENFFIEYGLQAINAKEYIHDFEIPNPKTKQFDFIAYKVSKRRYEDISTITGAFFFEKKLNMKSNVRFAYGGMAGIPKRSKSLENLFNQKFESNFDEKSIGMAIKNDFQPLTDCRATSLYRLRVAENLFKKFSCFVKNIPNIKEV